MRGRLAAILRARLGVRGMTKTILIVEDNEASLSLLRDFLEEEGYRVVATGEGVEAIALALENVPDLVLMDIQLPNISGLVLADFIRGNANLKHIPIIAVTAYEVREEEQLLTAKCDAIVRKPFSFDDLNAAIGKFLNAPRRASLP